MPRLSDTRFTETMLAKLRIAAGDRERMHNDSATRGLGIRFRDGRGTFFAWWMADGTYRRMYLGGWPQPLSLAAAHDALKLVQAQVARGHDPAADKQRERVARRAAAGPHAETVAAQFERFVKTKQAEGLRTVHEYSAVFDNHILPHWGKRLVAEIGRRDVMKLLDGIADAHGLMLSDRVLAYVRPFLLWHAAKNDRAPPILTKLRRIKADAMRRERSLNDDEIRLLWTTAESFEPAAFGLFIRLLLATGQRRIEVAGMRRDEIDADGLWTISASRFKGKRDHGVPLSKLARELIAAAPKLHDEFVLSTGRSHLRGFSKLKRQFDRAMLELARAEAEAAGRDSKKVKITAWRIHDLRRTARSLLSRAGVRPDWAERFIGHAMPGLRQTYDKHAFVQEKKFAADALAQMIGRILARDTADIVPFPSAEAAA